MVSLKDSLSLGTTCTPKEITMFKLSDALLVTLAGVGVIGITIVSMLKNSLDWIHGFILAAIFFTIAVVSYFVDKLQTR